MQRSYPRYAIFAGISVRSHMELPFYAKYLLLSAYLASYNPAHTDRRFFTKQGRRGLSNRAKAAAKKKKSNTQLTGLNFSSLKSVVDRGLQRRRFFFFASRPYTPAISPD